MTFFLSFFLSAFRLSTLFAKLSLNTFYPLEDRRLRYYNELIAIHLSLSSQKRIKKGFSAEIKLAYSEFSVIT